MLKNRVFSGKMGCNEVQLWTFVGLVGAYLDLSIAFLLLCASVLAYIVSNFLALFGLSLPCPCNGLFGDPNSGTCWQRVLVDCPSEKISSVQFSVKSKFPFDSIWDKDLIHESDVNPNSCQNDEFVSLDNEASCSSFMERSDRSVGSGVMSARDLMEEKFDVKGKGVWNQKARHALRRRRKGATSNGKFSASSFDTFQSEEQTLPQSPASVNKTANESNEDGRDSLMDAGLLGRQSPGLESIEPIEDKRPTENDGSNDENLKLNIRGELYDSNDEKNTNRVLELALEEEQAARSALYLELEKERSAAATAADEAMAMMLRLQEEKASIEMEARQYQRMIEEKSAYDLEEMNILKEILLRREREKHFLEKELETYRQMIFGGEQLDSDVQETGNSDENRASSLLHSSEDAMLMLQNISDSPCTTEKVKSADKFSEFEIAPPESPYHTLAFGRELSVEGLDIEIDEGFEELKLLSPEKSTSVQGREGKSFNMPTEIDLPTAERCTLLEKTVAPVEEVQQPTDIGTSQGPSKSIHTCDKTRSLTPYKFDGLKKCSGGSSNAISNMDQCVHDIHMIDDKLNMCDEAGGNGKGILPENVCLDIPKSCDSPVMNKSQTERNISRSCSEITSGLPPRGFLQKKPLLSDLRRNSMSAVDHERFKIDNEVGWLRERLRIIQEGREKLNVSMEPMEKENIQLQLLESIVSQLREIRQLTESRNSVGQVPLPHPSFKIMSKKRRWRSVSLEVTRST